MRSVRSSETTKPDPSIYRCRDGSVRTSKISGAGASMLRETMILLSLAIVRSSPGSRTSATGGGFGGQRGPGSLRAEPDLRRTREPRRLTVRLHSGGMPRRATRVGAPAYPVFSPARGDQHMSDQPSSGAAAAAPPPAAEAVQPLTPPVSTSSVLTLEPPAAVGVVNETAAPKMAPQVPAAAVPGLDAKVESYMTALLTAQAKSPTFDAKATDVRTMGDDDIRRAAESSNRLLRTPVKALKEGGLSETGKVGKTLLDLRRTVEDLDPSQARGGKKVLGM